MQKPGSDREKQPTSGGLPARRIETQIHRRKKAKAVPPLEAEWDAASGAKPTGLRTPPDKMTKAS
ncbi:hypothetical protein [Nitrospira sp. Kam-Ns4a]